MDLVFKSCSMASGCGRCFFAHLHVWFVCSGILGLDNLTNFRFYVVGLIVIWMVVHWNCDATSLPRKDSSPLHISPCLSCCFLLDNLLHGFPSCSSRRTQTKNCATGPCQAQWEANFGGAEVDREIRDQQVGGPNGLAWFGDQRGFEQKILGRHFVSCQKNIGEAAVRWFVHMIIIEKMNQWSVACSFNTRRLWSIMQGLWGSVG